MGVEMDSYFKASIIHANLSLNYTVSFFYILDNTSYNEGISNDMSDTPYRVGSLLNSGPDVMLNCT